MADRPLIVVSVGTDHHPFSRLVDWIDGWAADHPEVRVVVQRGTVDPTATAESHALISHGELCDLFADAIAVVTHGGPSTIMDVRDIGLRPIVFPRNPAFGEHIDDHQLRFANHLGEHGLAVVATNFERLDLVLTDVMQTPEQLQIPVDAAPAPGVFRFGQIVDGLIGASTPISPSLAGAGGGSSPEEGEQV